jgi:hypothetical protein
VKELKSPIKPKMKRVAKMTSSQNFLNIRATVVGGENQLLFMQLKFIPSNLQFEVEKVSFIIQ